MSLAPEQPKLAPVQPWGCPRARDIFGTNYYCYYYYYYYYYYY